MKYLSAMVAVKKTESEAAHSKSMKRSNFIKNMLLFPFDMGWSFVRDMRRGIRKG